MAKAPSQVESSEDVRELTLHLQLDMKQERHRALAEIIDGLPHGFKRQFCLYLMLSALPSEDADLDILLAGFIRARGQKNAPVSSAGARAVAPVPVVPAPVAASAPGAAGAEVVAVASVAAPVLAAVGLGEFKELAGGNQWRT